MLVSAHHSTVTRFEIDCADALTAGSLAFHLTYGSCPLAALPMLDDVEGGTILPYGDCQTLAVHSPADEKVMPQFCTMAVAVRGDATNAPVTSNKEKVHNLEAGRGPMM